MKKNKLKQQLIIILIIVSTIYTFYQKIEQKLSNNNQLQVHFIDVGQGDSTLIITPKGKNILIDAGDEAHFKTVEGYLKNRDIYRLDYVIATHPDADHIGGMDKIIKNFDIGLFSMPPISKDTMQYKEIQQELKNKNIKNTQVYQGDSINIDEKIHFDILSPINQKNYSDFNDYSIVAKISYKNTSFLLMADATMENEIDIINNIKDIKADVLKLGHHGSSTSTSEYFLQQVNPSIAVASCGKNNKYGHPHKEVMKLIEKYNIKLFRTDKDSNIVMISDGESIRLR